jgi:hypothetical protein
MTEFTPAIQTFRVTNAGAVYEVTAVNGETERWFLACTGMSGYNHGEWIRLGADSVAWSYLTEKMPGLARFGNADKPGWIMAFAQAGLEVFD